MTLVTLHTYTPTTWTNGSTQGTGGVGGTMTNIEGGIANLVTDINAHQQAATLDHPAGSVQASHMAASAATDTVVGNRTPDDTQTATSGGGTLTKCLSMLANIIKAITGGTHWYSTPATTIAALSTGKWNINSNGGGSAGTTIWVGTTDPGGSAAEGDIWIKA